MKNNLHTELRESWKKAMGKPPNFEVMDKLTGGMRCCALCGISADKIADWWLSKLDEFQSATSPDAIVKQHTCGRSIEGKKTCPVCTPVHDTLEELIDECDDKFGKLIRYKDDEGVFWKAWGYPGRGIEITEGSTPKEAVEKLLEELRKR